MVFEYKYSTGHNPFNQLSFSLSVNAGENYSKM